MAKVNGIRIQKVLSENGVMSRRKAEEAIAQGRVTVNGHPAQPGNPVDPSRDVIAVDGVRVQLRKKKQNVYIMLHKPRGFVTTTSDELGRRCVTDLVKDAPAHVYPVGRLDRNSEGLLLLTNDGAFANLVMHPSNHISKTYRVTVRPDVSDEQAAKMSAGVMLDGRMTLPATVLVLEKQDGRVVLQITIQEGRNRQVRRMCEAVGLEVARLKRTSVGPLKLGMLQPGQWRELRPGEVAALRKAASKKQAGGLSELNTGRRAARPPAGYFYMRRIPWPGQGKRKIAGYPAFVRRFVIAGNKYMQSAREGV